MLYDIGVILRMFGIPPAAPGGNGIPGNIALDGELPMPPRPACIALSAALL
jgi:hypothetical protein